MDLFRFPVVWVAAACHARPVLIHQCRMQISLMRLPIVGQQCGKEALLDLHAAMVWADLCAAYFFMAGARCIHRIYVMWFVLHGKPALCHIYAATIVTRHLIRA